MKKKLLSILLSIGLVLTMIPASVFADTTYTYTLEISGAKAAYAIYPSGGISKDEAIEIWETEQGPYLLDETYLGDGTWSDYYALYEDYYLGSEDIEKIKFEGSDGNFSLVYAPNVNWILLVLTKKTELTPGTPYVVYYGTSSDEGGSITIDTTPIDTGYLCSDEPSLNQSQDVTVGYTYTDNENGIAEKEFVVDVTFSTPNSLEVTGPANTYKWNSTDGKYELDEGTANTDNTYELLNDGAFSITLTNKSNVDIDYTISYQAKTDALFVSSLDGEMSNSSGTIETVAQGQEVTANGINITNSTEATTGNTNFNKATCAGKLTISGINTGKTLLASGTDTLGTFTVNIAETEPETVTKTIGEIINTTRNGFFMFMIDSDSEYSSISINESGNLEFSDNAEMGTPQTEEIELTENAVADGSDYVYTLENGAIVTFDIFEDELCSIIVSGETEKTHLNGTYLPLPSIKIADFVNAINNFPESYDDGLPNDNHGSGTIEAAKCYKDGTNIVIDDNQGTKYPFSLDTVLYWGEEFYIGEANKIVIATDDESPTGNYVGINFDCGEYSFYFNNPNLE